MFKRFAFIVVLIITLVACLLASGKPPEKDLKVGDKAPKFILKDADDKEYSLDQFLKREKDPIKVLILIIGDRSTRESGNKWASEFNKLYEKNKDIAMLMIADLRGLPFFVTEGLVKWGVKQEKTPVTILLDWDGKVNQLYKTEKGKSNIVIINSKGIISMYHKENYSDEAFKKVTAKIQEIINEDSQKI